MESGFESHAVQESVTCDDFGLFQDVLRRLRLIDDRIVSALNSSLPTESFKALKNSELQCKEFFEELDRAHLERQHIIKHCISEVSNTVSNLRKQRESTSDGDDPSLVMKLRKEQNKLRQMQAELNVEEIVRERSMKVFYDRCRLIHLPKDFRLS